MGADLNAKRNDGKTPLSLGIGFGDVPEAVEWLKANGAVCEGDYVNDKPNGKEKEQREEQERRKVEELQAERERREEQERKERKQKRQKKLAKNSFFTVLTLAPIIAAFISYTQANRKDWIPVPVFLFFFLLFFLLPLAILHFRDIDDEDACIISITISTPIIGIASIVFGLLIGSVWIFLAMVLALIMARKFPLREIFSKYF